MARVKKFEDLVVWQKAGELAVKVYRLFDENHDYGFRDQIQRACVSVMNNIAEGFESDGDKLKIRFLSIARASCGEVRSMLYLGLRLNYFNEEDFRRYVALTVEISKMLSSLITSIRESERD